MLSFFLFLGFLAIIIGVAVLASYIALIYSNGQLDEKYPSVADHDIYTGWRNKVYLAGKAAEVRAKAQRVINHADTKRRREIRKNEETV